MTIEYAQRMRKCNLAWDSDMAHTLAYSLQILNDSQSSVILASWVVCVVLPQLEVLHSIMSRLCMVIHRKGRLFKYIHYFVSSHCMCWINIWFIFFFTAQQKQHHFSCARNLNPFQNSVSLLFKKQVSCYFDAKWHSLNTCTDMTLAGVVKKRLTFCQSSVAQTWMKTLLA